MIRRNRLLPSTLWCTVSGLNSSTVARENQSWLEGRSKAFRQATLDKNGEPSRGRLVSTATHPHQGLQREFYFNFILFYLWSKSKLSETHSKTYLHWEKIKKQTWECWKHPHNFFLLCKKHVKAYMAYVACLYTGHLQQYFIVASFYNV